MKVLTEGHRYELVNFDDPESKGQIIQFIEKKPASEGSSELVLVNDGTTNEELMRVLINRIQFLNAKFPSRENSISITKIEEALMWQEKRTRDRQSRGVEGKALS
jgi:hypothetical protein